MKVGGTVAPEITRCDGLPPQEYWAIDPSIKTKTPVDSRGLIVVDELIESVKEYVCPEYDWGEWNDKHHLYYFKSVYKNAEKRSGGQVPAYSFRELPVNKVWIPRRFHNVIHKVTRPAPMPKPEVMRDYTAAWTATGDLFTSVCKAVRTERKLRQKWKSKRSPESLLDGSADREITDSVLQRHFEEIGLRIGALCSAPKAFRPLTPDAELSSLGSVSVLSSSMSRWGDVLQQGSQVRTRDVVLPRVGREPCPCLRCRVNSSIITSVNN